MNLKVEQRRPIRFSLRALIVFVLLCGLASFFLRVLIANVSAESVSASLANRLLWDVVSPLQVPATATNVTCGRDSIRPKPHLRSTNRISWTGPANGIGKWNQSSMAVAKQCKFCRNGLNLPFPNLLRTDIHSPTPLITEGGMLLMIDSSGEPGLAMRTTRPLRARPRSVTRNAVLALRANTATHAVNAGC